MIKNTHKTALHKNITQTLTKPQNIIIFYRKKRFLMIKNHHKTAKLVIDIAGTRKNHTNDDSIEALIQWDRKHPLYGFFEDSDTTLILA